MDLASIVGIVAGFILVFIGIVFGDQGMAALGNFVDPLSAVITFGGAFTCLLTMTNSFKDFIGGFASFSKAIKKPSVDIPGTIKHIITLSNTARKEGLLALEESAANVDDPFLKKGILLIVDGTDPELVRSILETELSCMEERHKEKFAFWDNMAAMGPAWGMIGTLIGLINMLKTLDDLDAVGPNMAIALVTTFYGSVLANWIATPISTKLKNNSSAEIMMKEVMVEGLLSIQAGENPRVIEEKLKSFLLPVTRDNLTTEEGENIG